MMNIFKKAREERAKEEKERKIELFNNACYYRALFNGDLVVKKGTEGCLTFSYPLYEDLKAEYGIC